MNQATSLSFLTASSRGGWAPETDDRWFADTERGLFYVADASGPTYGGYYAPFAADPGLAQFIDYFDNHPIEPELRLLRAVESAHLEMSRRHEEYNAVLGSKGGLEATRTAADRVRPAQWDHLAGRSMCHFATSITALFIEGNRFIVAQVGSCRAYLRRMNYVSY